MPYNKIEELPASIRKLPVKAQSMFLKAFNAVYDKHGEETSFQIAWGVVKKKFKKVDGKWIAKGMSANTYTFVLETKDDTFVQKAEDGNFYIEGYLSDTSPDLEGNSFSEEALKSFAEQINTHGLIGGITHDDWNELKMKYSHLPEEVFIAKARTERKGILKAIKAIYEKGKLWIKALVDKRYLNHINKFNKMSLEAIVPIALQKGKEFLGGTILGFALDNNAINPRATINSLS